MRNATNFLSFTLREEHRLRVFNNRALRRLECKRKEATGLD
jgi:hypothetical protein